LIKHDDLASDIKTNYTTDCMVLVGAGSVDHCKLVEAVEKSFGVLPVSSNLIPLSHNV
jgi:mitochondrial-processing peptidase subunit beta